MLGGKKNVVILGDSYSSGEGAGTYIDPTDSDKNPCHRSNLTYGNDLWPTSRTIIACSGAIAANMTNEQHPGVTPPQMDQLAALKTAPDLVLMSLGGNDADFKGVILTCLAPGDCNRRSIISEVLCEVVGPLVPQAEALVVQSILKPSYVGDALCFRDEGRWAKAKIDQALAVVPKLAKAYELVDDSLNSPRRLRERGGPAPIVVLAYPNPVPDPRRYDEVLKKCPKAFSYEDWKWLNTFIQTLNGAIGQAVEQARNSGIPIYFAAQTADAFEPAHTLCDTDKFTNYVDFSDTGGGIGADLLIKTTQWATKMWWLPNNTRKGRAISEQFHPNQNGYRAMTAALVQFSNTAPAMQPVVRNRPPALEVLPLPAGPVIKVESLTNARIDRGQTLTVVASNLQPGATAVLTVQSVLQVVDNADVAADGTATLTFDVPDNFDVGQHTLTVTSMTAAGELASNSYPVTVADPEPFWVAHGTLVSAIAAGVTLLFAMWLRLALWIRRRRQGTMVGARV